MSTKDRLSKLKERELQRAGVHPGRLGTRDRKTLQLSQLYFPSDPEAWGSSDPDTLGEAIDVLVARPSSPGSAHAFSFDVNDWVEVGGGIYALAVEHSLSSSFPRVVVYEEEEEVKPHSIRILSDSIVTLEVTSGARFSGRGLVAP